MAEVKISGLHKKYGGFHAVRGIDLDIPDGEFTVLVGPSGCGKSTLLRTIAGLEDITDGDDRDRRRGRQRHAPARPRRRDGVPGLRALSAHDGGRNIGFGLKARKMSKAEIETRVRAAAEMLGITELLDRLPRQISGGQRQRVAIGRAIVRSPRIFLFDEPLSNLDAQLRDEMRGEIKRLHQEISTTMIYVTHDQIEAMTLADRIVLMRDGVIEQQGAPLDLFERPASIFVAGFLGSPKMTFLPGRLDRQAEGAAVALKDGAVALPLPADRVLDGAKDGQPVILGIRPEHVSRANGPAAAAGARPEGRDHRLAAAHRFAHLRDLSAGGHAGHGRTRGA